MSNKRDPNDLTGWQLTLIVIAVIVFAAMSKGDPSLLEALAAFLMRGAG